MKNVYLVDFQNYYSALGFSFKIEYYSDDTFKLVAENEDGQVETVCEDNNDNVSAHTLDVKIKDFLLDHIQTKLLQYDDLNIERHYEPWSGFVIAGRTFKINDFKDDYGSFLKNILNFVELCEQDTK